MSTISEAIALFDQQRYREAFAAFAEIYNQSEDPQERQNIFHMLEEAYYTPNREELRELYKYNVALLKKYPYFWNKSFHEFNELNVRLFPVSEGIFFCYDCKKDCFYGEYDAVTRHQMRYFFENLDQPLQIKDEDNFYNLIFLNDNVRASEDFAGDNHIYLLYTSIEPLERLMQASDLETVLQQEKFVFLVGETNWSKYPINFKKKFGVDYRKKMPALLRIEEINRIYLNQFYNYSGTDFFEGVLNGSDHFLVMNGWFFYESAKEVIETYLDYVTHPDRMVSVSKFLAYVNAHIADIKLSGWPQMVSFLPAILADRKEAAFHELWKAVMIAAMQVSERIEGKQYLSRISPAIFYDPHGGPCANYYELLKYFKYPAVEATVREPVMRLARIMESLGPHNKELFKSIIRSTYEHSKNIPKWLTDSGFYVAKLEDLKLKPEMTLRAVCRTLNIPYTEKLLVGKIGMWGVLFTNEKGEQLQGFDQRSVKRDVSNTVPPQDKERLDLYYWPIHRYFRYPCAEEPRHLTPSEAKTLFSAPFRFEQLYAAQRAAYLEALRTAPPEQRVDIQAYVNSRFSMEPEEIRNVLDSVLVSDYLSGFDEDLALPEVMFPLDEVQLPSISQTHRLNLLAEQAMAVRDTKPSSRPSVYWLTGLSGAGKTTIGRLWYERLKEVGESVVFLDGDELRQVFGDDLGYTAEDRRKSAMRNARLCALLAKQGITVVCCTISMFDSVREWNRENIPGYFEVYVRASMETLRKRDQKGLYSSGEQDVAGIHFQIEEPKKPDLILENDGEKTPEEQILILWKARDH